MNLLQCRYLHIKPVAFFEYRYGGCTVRCKWMVVGAPDLLQELHNTPMAQVVLIWHK